MLSLDLCMCMKTSEKGWRRVRNTCDDLAIVLREVLHVYFLANRSRPVQDACEDFVIPCERLAMV